MKFKSDILSIISGVLILIAIFAVTFFFPFFNFYTMELDSFYFIMLGLTILGGLLFFLSDRIFKYYYLSKKSFTIKKTFSKEEVLFDKIIFIDEKKLKKGMLVFYTDTGRKYSLIPDRKKKMIEPFIKNCKKLINEEEFYQRFPLFQEKKKDRLF